MKIPLIDPERCDGCMSCVMACAVGHGERGSETYARIRIRRFMEEPKYVPVVCMACDEAPCIDVCPMNARFRHEAGGWVDTDPERCIGCRACLYICPAAAPTIHPETGKSMSCDRCRNDPIGPWCEQACTLKGAIRFVDPHQIHRGSHDHPDCRKWHCRK
uniref:4Fe-4S dicluster domain-containing protein n=1 Tax=Desulfatirhabdium butyrativorans TaxID=340467 RepID=A0A7C4MP29_9BACT